MSFLLKNLDLKYKTKTFKSGECVFLLDAPVKHLFYVDKGSVHLYRDDQSGKRIVLHRAYQGDFFAEASINANNYHCTAECTSDSIIYLIATNCFKEELERNQKFSSQWIQYLSTQLRSQRASVERLNLKSASERILHYINIEGEGGTQYLIKGSLSDFALVLGLSRESLYRTLAAMKNEGVITHAEGVIQIIKNKY